MYKFNSSVIVHFKIKSVEYKEWSAYPHIMSFRFVFCCNAKASEIDIRICWIHYENHSQIDLSTNTNNKYGQINEHS